MTNYSTLSDKAIKRYMEKGEIVIEPYNDKNLNTSSYDVTLGPWFYREQIVQDECVSNIYNIYSEDHVKRVWGEAQHAKPYSYYKQHGIVLENIDDNELLIFINPGERILAHTVEFIGGVNSVTTMMKSRSSMGRNFIFVCQCAGWGDCGYFNRWTMEISNNSQRYKIPLVVGRRIAQIVFFDTEGIQDQNYNKTGKYQTKSTLQEIKDTWKPSDMLPKLYHDRDIKS